MQASATLKAALGKNSEFLISNEVGKDYSIGLGESFFDSLPLKSQELVNDLLKTSGKDKPTDKEIFDAVVTIAGLIKGVVLSPERSLEKDKKFAFEHFQQWTLERLQAAKDEEFLKDLEQLKNIRIEPIVLNEENTFMNKSDGQNSVKDHVNQMESTHKEITALKESPSIKEALKSGNVKNIGPEERIKIAQKVKELTSQSRSINKESKVLKPKQKDIDNVFTNLVKKENNKGLQEMSNIGMRPSEHAKNNLRAIVSPDKSNLSLPILQRLFNTIQNAFKGNPKVAEQIIKPKVATDSTIAINNVNTPVNTSVNTKRVAKNQSTTIKDSMSDFLKEKGFAPELVKLSRQALEKKEELKRELKKSSVPPMGLVPKKII